MRDASEGFVLVVEAAPGWRCPVHVRLRRLLKSMLRAYGLRVVEVKTKLDQLSGVNTDEASRKQATR